MMRYARPRRLVFLCLVIAIVAGCGTGWPFDQEPNAAAFASRAVVFSDAPVLTVFHYSDDHSWAFLNEKELRSENIAVVSMAQAVRLDATLREVAGLPPGWRATRDHVGGPWIRTAGE
jgi:hypothetical protein